MLSLWRNLVLGGSDRNADPWCWIVLRGAKEAIAALFGHVGLGAILGMVARLPDRSIQKRPLYDIRR